jgi:NADPH:quinone reductase-like Zn-dependent oxidoreductase
MRAARIHSYGGPTVVNVEDVATPDPVADQVLIRVQADGINPIDWKMREGYLLMPLTFPISLGEEVAGIAERVGANT